MLQEHLLTTLYFSMFKRQICHKAEVLLAVANQKNSVADSQQAFSYVLNRTSKFILYCIETMYIKIMFCKLTTFPWSCCREVLFLMLNPTDDDLCDSFQYLYSKSENQIDIIKFQNEGLCYYKRWTYVGKCVFAKLESFFHCNDN